MSGNSTSTCRTSDLLIWTATFFSTRFQAAAASRFRLSPQCPDFYDDFWAAVPAQMSPRALSHNGSRHLNRERHSTSPAFTRADRQHATAPASTRSLSLLASSNASCTTTLSKEFTRLNASAYGYSTARHSASSDLPASSPVSVRAPVTHRGYRSSTTGPNGRKFHFRRARRCHKSNLRDAFIVLHNADAIGIRYSAAYSRRRAFGCSVLAPSADA